MKNLGNTIDKIAKKLDEMERRQDEVLALNRELVRDCAKTISSVHSGDLKNAKEFERKADENAKKLFALQKELEKNASGAFQEYAEVKCLMAILEKKPLPDYEKLGVDYRAFLSGLADTVGELRRAMLIALRHKNRKEAEYLFESMESIYDKLMVLKYSSSLVGALKSKQDSIRAQVEKARSELLEIKVR